MQRAEPWDSQVPYLSIGIDHKEQLHSCVPFCTIGSMTMKPGGGRSTGDLTNHRIKRTKIRKKNPLDFGHEYTNNSIAGVWNVKASHCTLKETRLFPRHLKIKYFASFS